MTFSPLISGTVPHHNKYSERTGSIIGIVQHHWASNNSSGEAALIDPTKKKSATYLVYNDGTIKGQVPEEYRAWTSGSLDADGRRITIECQNETNAPDWKISDAAYGAVLRLIVDIAKRHHWLSLNDVNYRGHRTFASTACPGPYLWGLLPQLRAEGTKLIGGTTPPPVVPPTTGGHPQLIVDGKWGKATTSRQQERASTPIDGVISHQWKSPANQNIYSAQFDKTGDGSTLGRWIQRRLTLLGFYSGAEDGLLGEKSVFGLQKYYGTPQDGVISPVSTVVKAIQTELNTKNTFLGV